VLKKRIHMESPEIRLETSTRAGRYITQPTGYRAFIPAPLPPSPPIQTSQATDTARRILDLREVHRRSITDSLGRAAGNGHRVLEHLYQHPIVSVNEIRRWIGTTYPAANDLVSRMVDIGILREFTGQARNRKFNYQSYIELFHDPEPEAGA
jgi:hypothetical protein